MEFKKVCFREGKYYLNEEQFFMVDREKIKKEMGEWSFPMLIMDTEFFNKSHDKFKIRPSAYTRKNPDIIYTLSFSIAQSYKDLLDRNNDRSVTSYSIHRRNSDKNFDAQKQMDKLLTKFFNMAFHKNIKSLVFAGKANDQIILNNWINQHTTVLNNKVTELFTKDPTTKKWAVKALDAYDVLKDGFSVSNTLQGNLQYDADNNLKNGSIGENTKQIPGLRRFYEYVTLFPNIEQLDEEDNIYDLCVDVLRLFSLPYKKNKMINQDQHSLKLAIRHCRNDVVKLLYLIYFLHCFGNMDDKSNPFVAA